MRNFTANPKVLVLSPVMPAYNWRRATDGSQTWRTWVVDSGGDLTQNYSMYDLHKMGC